MPFGSNPVRRATRPKRAQAGVERRPVDAAPCSVVEEWIFGSALREEAFLHPCDDQRLDAARAERERHCDADGARRQRLADVEFAIGELADQPLGIRREGGLFVGQPIELV